MYISYLGLLNMPYKKKRIVFVMLIILGFCLVVLLKLDLYNVYVTRGFVIDDSTSITIRPEDLDIFLKNEYVSINKEKHTLEVLSVSSVAIDRDSQERYQIIDVLIDKKLENNSVFNIEIYYNKESVYEKIKKFLF